MKVCKLFFFMISFLVFCQFITGMASAQRVWYVNKNAAGTADGNSWANAFPSLQISIDGATFGDQIWVAEGTYSESIMLASGVSVYGGFSGVETDLSERAIRDHQTIIDGSTADGGTAAHHVVVLDSITNARLDGFTITGGSANASSPNNNGGGIYCYKADATNSIENCTISGNSALNNGGGMYLSYYSSPAITNCTISGNSA